MRGFAPATRVISRKEAPAAASGSWPSIGDGADLVEEQVRERVREVADEREQPVVRLRVDCDGNRAERCDEGVQAR